MKNWLDKQLANGSKRRQGTFCARPLAFYLIFARANGNSRWEVTFETTSNTCIYLTWRKVVDEHEELRVIFGDYIVKPDIVVCRKPVPDSKINESEVLLTDDGTAVHTPLRLANSETDIMHASISCKWTIRSDRSQNARTEGLNLVRNRKGKTPHIVVVVGEPLPGRIASLAYGTGDIDCVYHFALRELMDAASDSDSETELLKTLVTG